MRLASQVLQGQGRRFLDRRRGVAHHRVVVRWWAVTLQASIQGRVIQGCVVQAEVQGGNCGGVLLLLCVTPHRLFAFTHGLHSEITKR